MAEERTDATEPAEPRGSWLKQFMILAVIVLLGQSVVAYVLVTKEIIPRYLGLTEEGGEEGDVEKAQKAQRAVVPVDAPFLYEMDEMTLNPQDYHTIRYLNIKLALEVNSQATLDLLRSDNIVETKLTDVVHSTLNAMAYRDINEAEEREPMRKKLMAAINASGVLKKGSVTGVYFEQFILQ